VDPQDDPEARIRELERSLADQARKSELVGRRQESYSDPPASPTPYGAPFRPTPRSWSEIPTRWIVLGVLFIVAIFVAPIVVGMVIMFSAVNSAFDEARQSPDATSATTTTTTTTTSTRTSTTTPTTTEDSIEQVPPNGVHYYGFGVNKTMACNDSSVRIDGDDNTIVIIGHCVSLEVNGTHNDVTVGSADAISAGGSRNHVTYRSGSPRIDNSSSSSVVAHG
jgi:cytoskeletal protein RodZ